MCTRVVWPDADGSVITGRNMDFQFDLFTNLWKMPRGVERTDGVYNKLTWKAKYGSIVATAFDLIAADGMNEKGLGGHILWLTEANYGEHPEGDTQLSQAVWLQYYLDNFATVEEAVEWTRQSNVKIRQLFDPTGHIVPVLHLALNDSTGDSAIIEYTDGEPTVYHDRAYQVMTNSPPFDQQLELVKQYSGLGGDATLPGTTDAKDRFARASFYVSQQVQPKSQTEAIAAMYSIIRNCAQPYRKPDATHPEQSKTIWQVVLDQTKMRYIFESTNRPNIVWLDFASLDFSEDSDIQKLNLLGDLAIEGGLAGDVSGEFKNTDGLSTFTVDEGIKILEFVANHRDEFAEIAKKISESVPSKRNQHDTSK